MRITAESIAIGAGPSAALPPVSFDVAPDEPVFVAVDTAARPTVLALAATARMRLDSGRVLVDGRVLPDVLRTASAIVDAPGVSDPPDDVVTRHIVREEFVLAGRAASPRDVSRLLERAGALDHAAAPFGSLPGAARTRLLAECAALRRGVDALVLTSPERHGGDPRDLRELVEGLDARGFAVLVLTSAAMLGAVGGRAR